MEPIVCEEVLEISIDAGNGTFSSRKFALKDVVNHNGTLSNGHYTAIVEDKSQDSWSHCDLLVPCGKEILQSDRAYLLFYEDVSLGNCD